MSIFITVIPALFTTSCLLPDAAPPARVEEFRRLAHRHSDEFRLAFYVFLGRCADLTLNWTYLLRSMTAGRRR